MKIKIGDLDKIYVGKKTFVFLKYYNYNVVIQVIYSLLIRVKLKLKIQFIYIYKMHGRWLQ